MRLSSVIAASALCAATFPAWADSLQGWFLAGSAPADYTASADHSSRHSGKASALLASKADSPKGFGTLMQTAQAEPFKGKRLKFTAHIRSESITEWAGLWLRVDGPTQTPLAFDNMNDRPIKGSSSWQPYSIVLDVPKEATAIAFGVLLNGAGKVWLDTATFQVVDKSVPTTGAKLPPAPFNLDFEE